MSETFGVGVLRHRWNDKTLLRESWSQAVSFYMCIIWRWQLNHSRSIGYILPCGFPAKVLPLLLSTRTPVGLKA
jgi:hypothetical protein